MTNLVTFLSSFVFSTKMRKNWKLEKPQNATFYLTPLFKKIISGGEGGMGGWVSLNAQFACALKKSKALTAYLTKDTIITKVHISFKGIAQQQKRWQHIWPRTQL